MDLSIIIVNFNVKHFLEHCLSSVEKAIAPIAAEVFIVDNNSTDGSLLYFQDRFTQFKFIQNEVNVGFATANNIALKQAKGKFVLFLNPDTIVAEDSFTKCLAFFNDHANCGALGVRMIDGAGNFLKESKRSFPSPLTSLYKLAGFANLFPHHKTFAKYHLGNLSEHQNNEVDVLAGAYMMVRKSVLDEVGSFDESFFMYGEDVDLSYRIQKAGYKNYFFADTTIIHFKGESTKRGSLNYIKMFYKAMSQFVNKHYGSQSAGFFTLFIKLAIYFRGFIAATKRFVLWIGLPIIDACIILFSIWQVKLFWFHYVKPDVRYIRGVVITSALIYTGIYILISLLSGLYDKPYKQVRTNRAAILSTLVLLSFYALLPEQFRYSRGITAVSAVAIFIALTLCRWLLVKLQILDADKQAIEEKQTVVVSNAEDFTSINNIYNSAAINNRLLGQIDTTNQNGLMGYSNFKALSQQINFNSILFSTDSLPIKQIITDLANFPKYRIKFFSKNCNSIISSDGQKAIGESITPDGLFEIESASAKRTKRLFDVISTIILIVLSPIVFVIGKKVKHIYASLPSVLFGQKTWIGYSHQNGFPAIKPAVFTQISHITETVNEPLKQQLDYRYAKTYNYSFDIKLLLINIFRK